MSSKLSKNQLEKFSRQIILKDIGILGQKKILNSRVLIIGMGGLGCPVAEFLTRSGVGSLGIVDHDLVDLSNIHRQTLYDEKDLGKLKVNAAKNNISVLNTPGTIDSDYRGEIKVILYNHGNTDFLINNKDRIAQMILTPVIKMDLKETDTLPETVRGEGGFGSTGKWVQN